MKRYSIFAFLTVTLIGLFFFLPLNIEAQQQQFGFSISPPSFELTANPGDRIENSLKIQNLSPNAIGINIKNENFYAYGNEGQITLTEDSSTYSISDWIKYEQSSIVVNQNETYTFNFAIEIPSNTEPGSHYGAIVFSTADAGVQSNGASVVQEIGAIVLIRIPGDIQEEANLISFNPVQSVFQDPVINLESLVENTGTVHIKPYGVLTITDILGNTVKTINIEGKNVLPGSQRTFNQSFDFENIGIYRANLQLLYKDGTKIISGETSFISLYKDRLIPIMVVAVLLIAFYIIFRKRINKAVKIIVKG